MKRSSALLLPVLCAAFAACQPPTPDTTERIIRIQIEGCEDAAPLLLIPTPAAVQTPTKVAVVADTGNPTETPAVIQPRVERTPPPAARTAEALAEEFALKREGFFATLKDAKLHPLDLPEATKNLRKADDLLRAKNLDEALRYVEVAILEAQSTRMNEAFITQKLRRVEARVDAMRSILGKPAERKADEALKSANTAFMNNSFRGANAALYELELVLDRRADATRKPPAR